MERTARVDGKAAIQYVGYGADPASRIDQFIEFYDKTTHYALSFQGAAGLDASTRNEYPLLIDHNSSRASEIAIANSDRSL